MKSHSKWIFLFIVGFILIFLSACIPAPVCDTDYYVTKIADTNDWVCSSLDCSLREAVINANACTGPHTIHLPAGGYMLTIPGIDEDDLYTGDLDIKRNLVIIGTGAPSIHGNIDRAFHIHDPAEVVFDHVWLADGNAIIGGGVLNDSKLTADHFTCNYNSVEIPPGGMGDARGGCIFNGGELTITTGQFLANTAEYGGAIYNNDKAVLNIEDVNFFGNEADDHGGAIWNGPDATLNITGGEYRMNEARVHGGGIWNNGTIEAADLYFEDNHAEGNGGGFFNWVSGQGALYNTWFTLNTADLGGAVYNEEGMLHLYQSGLTENTAIGGAGGGAYNLGPAGGFLLLNTTISANIATGGLGGGGIYNTGNIQLRFITVADNNPEGIRVDGGMETTIRSSALAYNTGGNCAGIPLDSGGYNIENDGSCSFAGIDDLPSTDPLLEPLAAFAGMAPSHALGVSSPAIDSGDPDRCTAIDQHGTTRPQGAACDRGAHENLSTSGFIRGWTYIDDNDNSIRDPGEGTVTGAMLTLKEGPCPGGSEIITVESDSSGFYMIVDIDPGDVCLASSPLQQTADPVSYDLAISAGDILEDINFRYLYPVPDASASGLVWHDLCAVPYSPPASPPPGCVNLGGGSLGANGVLESLEPGIGGLEVKIGTGPCPITLILTTVPTDINGEFSFPYLFAGTYCVTVDAQAPPNDLILIPGVWTYPVRGADPAEVEITTTSGGHVGDVNFGWDYQFLPAPEASIPACVLLKDAHLRMGPHDIDFPSLTAFLKGHKLELLAVSEPGRPLWGYFRDADGFEGWVYIGPPPSKIVDCGNFDYKNAETRPAPPVPEPTPEPTKTPTPIACSPNLLESACIKAGGTWSLGNTAAGTCICP